MKKLIKFALFAIFTFIPATAAFAVNATDYTSLNNALTSAATNPTVNTIDISTDSIIFAGNLAAISNKTIILQSASTALFDGGGTYKGISANSGSNLTFTNINFKNSFTTSGSGGFISVNSSTASFGGSTTAFSGGFAVNGGAFAAENNSYVTFSDDALFDSNTAVDYGGGFYSRQSTIVFDNDAEFKNNTSQYSGGAFYADTGSNISFNGHANFSGNSAVENNGAGFYAYRSTLTFITANFENNISSDIGGGFYSSFSNIIFKDSATFTGNFGKHSGGAFSTGNSSNIEFRRKTLFNSNISHAEGGAIDIYASTVTFSEDVEFNNNISGSMGGGFYIEENSYMHFDKSVIFNNNKAAIAGGAAAIVKSDVLINSASTFKNNSADLGGAVYINSGNMSLNDTVFDGNNAASAGGAVYVRGASASVKGRLTVQTNNETVFQNNKSGNKSNALFLDSFSSAEFNTATGAAVQMRDAISGSGYDSTLIISGAGIFNLYNNITDVDITVAGTSGSAFNLISAAKIDAGRLIIGNGSKFNTVNNTADIVKVTGLDIGGTLSMEISEFGIHDQIISSGDVNLNPSSSLEVIADISDTNFRKKTYMLINTPENINGIFGSVSVTTPSFAYSPIVNYGDVFDKWITLTILGTNPKTDFYSSISGLSFNQQQTAKTYDALSATSSGDLDAIISFIEGMDENEQKKALALASGYFLANVIRSAAVEAEYNEIYDRIKNHCLYEDSESGIWAQLRGAATTYSKDENSLNDFNDTSSGIMIGFDRFIEENKIMLGFYGKYNTHNIEQGLHDADITNKTLGFYGGLIENEWEVKALISGSYDNYNTKRHISFADRKAKADFDGTTFGADIEGALKFKFEEYINLRPYFGIEAKNSHYNGFKENGAESLNLEVAGDSYVRSAARLGVGAVYDNNIFGWYINAEAKYLISGDSPEIESAFERSDLMFRSRGSEEGNMIFGAIAGASVRITREFKVFVNGSYYGAEHFKNLYGSIGVRWNFCTPQSEKKPKPVKVSESRSKPKNDNYDAAKYLLALADEEPKEMDAVITFEEAPMSAQKEEERDTALELLKASEEEPAQQLTKDDDEYDAAIELLNALQPPEPAKPEPVVDESVKEINMEDAKVAMEQQKEAALRRSKPVLKSFSLNMANFATGKSQLTEKAKENIRLQAAEIKNFKYEKITIEGHTDSTGSAVINKKISRERAKAVFDIFAEEGISAKKMSYIGFSSLLPVASNNTIEGRSQNRRVEIFVE